MDLNTSNNKFNEYNLINILLLYDPFFLETLSRTSTIGVTIYCYVINVIVDKKVGHRSNN